MSTLSLISQSPLLSAAIGIWGATMLAFLTKDIPRTLWTTISRQLTTSLGVTSEEETFLALTRWIEDNGYVGRFRSLRIRKSEVSAGLGRHYFLYQRHLCWFYRRRIDGKSEREIEEIVFTCLSRNQLLLRNLVKTATRSMDRPDLTKIYVPSHYGHKWEKLISQVKREMSSVILPQTQKYRILAHLDWFLKSREWYRTHGIPYRTGICFYGPPGTGKTTLARTICAQYDFDLYIADLTHTCDKDFKELVWKIPPRSLLLIEDIDTVAATKKREDGSSASTEDVITLGGLLNAIDGVVESDGRIIVVTTNHIDKIDSALLRPGRIDLNLEIGLMTDEMLREGFARYYPRFELNDSISWKSNISPAEFQMLALEQRDPNWVLEQVTIPALKLLKEEP